MTKEDNKEKRASESADSSPTKLFFSQMLTRDIEVDDAILDLIDNCVDGAMRMNKDTSKSDYTGYLVDIAISKDVFTILDNCGGIPHTILMNVALRMGRLLGDTRDEGLATVGVYGIGMKRAIFKLGKDTTLYTQTSEGAYEVHYTEDWLNSDDSWEINVDSVSSNLKQNGTKIIVNKLREDICSLFSQKVFQDGLIKKISKHFSYVMEKGLVIKVNGEAVTGMEISLLLDDNSFSDSGIAPYVYKTTIDDIEILLAVGFYTSLPTVDDMEDPSSIASNRASSEKAGWTVICNDRVILYADKTMNTGWGEADVPRYHTQFVSIAGIVKFHSANPIKLPVSTTKQSMQGDSPIWLKTKNVMRKGLKVFTDYTNHWKANLDEEKEHRKEAKLTSISDVITKIPDSQWKADRGEPGAKKFSPNLPVPKPTPDMCFMRFPRPSDQISAVSQILFDKPTLEPSKVGAACFDAIYSGQFIRAKENE